MKVVGLTGGMGSGKSVISRAFSALGAPVFDADKTARAIYQNPDVRTAVIALLGHESYQGLYPNRAFIASSVFGHAERLEALNRIIHPRVREQWIQWKDQQTAPYCIREAAILIESGAAADCDEIIVVNAPEDERVRRVMHRDHTTESSVRSRMQHQMKDEDRQQFATHILENDGKSLILPIILKLHVSFSVK